MANLNDLSSRLFFLVEFLNLQEATGDPEARWEEFQLKNLNNQSLLSIDLKSRQVGWSWLAAAGSVADCHINDRSTNIFLSINLAEASEKIRYAKHVHEALDPDVRKKLVIDNRFELEFENGSRIISHPCRPLRGKARANIYLDEFAHYPNDQEIYQSVLPVLSKGGSLRIGSSPLGARGRFWEIFTQRIQKFPGYKRKAIPWWMIRAFCKDIENAKKLAPHMNTDDRVRLFGTNRLITIYENSVLEDFQQEYECAWLDEAISWISWDLIKRNQILAQQGKLWYRIVNGVDEGLAVIDEVARAIIEGKVEDRLVGGMDMGRTKDKSEIVLTGRTMLDHLPFRLNISMANTEFDDQFAVLCRLMDTLPIIRMLIDQTGLGMQLAEDAHRRYSDRCEGVTFSGASKQKWATDAKLKAERGEVPLPLERDFIYQIHSIRKLVSSSQTIQFDNDRGEGHHADKFWAWALALAAAGETFGSLEVGHNVLSTYRG
ncbi:terminase large subunit domain-containing protein [Ornatilinea apprima]|uniref:terminase large subunit domain-containing protein n=1 Tax=Ornatilinea apprima TaxID=1134406 RepID=UPI000946700D|nr:terminase family protein [Ornatilinea apprima]